jgi:hypothetical protein
MEEIVDVWSEIAFAKASLLGRATVSACA